MLRKLSSKALEERIGGREPRVACGMQCGRRARAISLRLDGSDNKPCIEDSAFLCCDSRCMKERQARTNGKERLYVIGMGGWKALCGDTESPTVQRYFQKLLLKAVDGR